ncbi:MAG: beta-galactosidase [bacterium]
MKAVHVAADRWNFQLAGTTDFITPLGGNMLNDQHPAQGTLFQDFNADDVDRRFGIMADLGLNCVRQAIGVNEVYDPQTGLKAAGMKNWDMFISLAEKHGVYLMPVGGYIGGNDWFDVEKLADNGKSLDESCAFWNDFVGHYSGNPAIWAWDLRNELLYSSVPHMTVEATPDQLRIDAMLKDTWPTWLEQKYGTVATMNRCYGTAYSSFNEVSGSVLFIEKPYDLCANDFRIYMNDRGYDWCKRQCDTIRAVSPDHMIVSGNNGWASPDQDLWLANGFHNYAIHDLFDFVTHHPYPAWQAVPDGRGDPLDGGEKLTYWINACIGMSRLDHYGKPVVLQEFGWYGGGASRFISELPYRSEQEHADYTRTLCDTLIPHINGFINWPTFDMPASNDISNHGGIFTANGERKALAKVYGDLVTKLQGKRQVRQRATTTLTYSLLALYTCRKYQDDMWDEVNEVINAGEVPDFRFI